MNILSWSLSVLESYSPVKAGKGETFPTMGKGASSPRAFLLDRLCLGQAGSPKGPPHGPLHFLVAETVDDGVAHRNDDAIKERQRLVFVRPMCAARIHV
jgi:hypothetical protein